MKEENDEISQPIYEFGSLVEFIKRFKHHFIKLFHGFEYMDQ
jgi:hypothetical protein